MEIIEEHRSTERRQSHDKIEFIAPFIDIPMFNVKYLAMHKLQMHGGAISKL